MITQKVEEALARQAAVALIGPRQVGKTTLAFTLAEQNGTIYLDLESRTDRDKLTRIIHKCCRALACSPVQAGGRLFARNESLLRRP